MKNRQKTIKKLPEKKHGKETENKAVNRPEIRAESSTGKTGQKKARIRMENWLENRTKIRQKTWKKAGFKTENGAKKN